MTMKLYIIALAIIACLLNSCTHYEVKSGQKDDHPCYSDWHYQPHNG